MFSQRRRAAFHEAGHVCCALVYSIPIIRVTINAATPHLLRAYYRPPPGIGLEAMCVLCLSGPAAEEYFCGPITDGADRADIEMAKRHLARTCNLVMIGTGIRQARDAADRLVRTLSVRDQIRRIAAALLEHGSLTGEEIAALGAPKCF